MNCFDFLPLISGHIDQVNTVQEEQALQAHLASCPVCRETLAQMEQTNALLNASVVAPPADLTQRIMKEVRKNPKKSRVNKPAIVSAVVSGLTVAAVMALVFLGKPFLSGMKAASAEPYAEAAEAEPEYETAAFCDEAEEGIPEVQTATGAAVNETDAPAEEAFLGSDSFSGSGNYPEALETYAGDSHTTLAKRGTHTDTVAGLPAPVLVIWNAETSAFPELSGSEPIQLDEALLADAVAQLPDTLLSRLSPNFEQDDTSWIGEEASNINIYLLPYDAMNQLLTQCVGQYETNVFYPSELLSAENCIIIVVRQTSE